MKKYEIVIMAALMLAFIGVASISIAQSDLTTNTDYPYSKAYQNQSAWVGEKGRVRWDMVTYSVDRQGGTPNAAGLIDLGIDIPDNAIIIDGLVDVITTQLPLTNTVAIQLNTANDIITAATNFASGTGLYATIPVGTAATGVKATADRDLSMAITGVITQGVWKIWIKSYLSQ